MSQFHTKGKTCCSTEDVRTTCNRSSGQGLIAGGPGSKQGRHTIFFTPLNPFGPNPDEEKFSDDLSKPRKVHYESKWKTNQDAVYWISLARAQDKGLQLWQTRSHSSVSADCIYKVISKRAETTVFERLSTPRLAPKIVLKSNWQLQQQQQQQPQQPDTLEGPTSASIGKPLREGFVPEKEEPEFEVDLRIEGIAQDAILKDEERMGKIKNWIPTKRRIQSVRRKGKSKDLRARQH